jgi:hypothetical protein
MSKINGLFQGDSKEKEPPLMNEEPSQSRQPAKTPNLKDKMEAAKKKVKANEDSTIPKQKNKNVPEL